MPKQVVIENPILNSPFLEPNRHFKFDEEGITNDIIESRRISNYFVPIPQPRRKGRQQSFEAEWARDTIKENKFINEVRGHVSSWRKGDWRGATSVTRKLLEYWTSKERENKLFFCQIEAVETAIYIAEVATRHGDTYTENTLRGYNAEANPDLYRIAFKMATGSGKTVVMAMLIAWQALNKIANPQDARFSDTFLIVTPGITIRDRLRVLLPNDPNNYYRERDIISAQDLETLHKAKVLITNYHAFLLRETTDAGKLTKDILGRGKKDPFKETPDQMVRRVLRDFGNKKNIVVINDEAHHCYRRKVDVETDDEPLSGDEKKEAQKREEEARIWISGLEAIQRKIGIRSVYDLSATPFFLKGSGYPEGTLFPWVVSDFSLIDAIEAGIVKVPRVPVSDNAGVSDQPTYRDLWLHIRDHLPKKGRKTDALTGEPKLPSELEGALQTLYLNYKKYYQKWEKNSEARANGSTPPVFIVVCNNTNVSNMVYRYISGWEKVLANGESVLVPGNLDIFSNVHGSTWHSRPNTILVDSEQLESGDAMSDEFKKIAAYEIEEFKNEYRARFPGRDVDKLTDEDLLREVMNTVGKQGKLGENIKCVVSVSMLTEGWDANTVTHILGVRAFGTQLLCEQVVGRGLRRMSYVPNDDGKFDPEYAEVYGVPFSFIPTSGSSADPKPPRTPTRVRALQERDYLAISFPRLQGYRYEIPEERLSYSFNEKSVLTITTRDLPTDTENAPIVGESVNLNLDELKSRREQEVAFRLAKRVLEEYFKDNEGNLKQWLFPQILSITKKWLAECVELKDDCFIQEILFAELASKAADKIFLAIARGESGERKILPRMYEYDAIGSTEHVDFNTLRATYRTRPEKCHISHVVCDTDSWEQKLAEALEAMPEVVSYVKNHNLGFTIPYTFNGEEHQYIPDFIVRIRDGKGKDENDFLNLIIEVTGEKKAEKVVKVDTAQTLWIPAVNNDGRFGRWSFIEVTEAVSFKSSLQTILS